MAINGIEQYGGMYQNYKIPAIQPAEQKEAAVAQPVTQESENRSNEYTSFLKEQEKQAPKTADLENISLTFQKNDEFDYLGKDSDIANLDVQKAVSDMQKDQVLQEYQYFVGSAMGDTFAQDGIVIQKGERNN